MKIGYASIDPTVLGPMVNAGQYQAAYDYGIAVGYSPDDLANWLNMTYGTAQTGASLQAAYAPYVAPPAPVAVPVAPVTMYPPTVAYNIDGQRIELDGKYFRWAWGVLYETNTGIGQAGYYQSAEDAARAKSSIIATINNPAVVGGGMTHAEQSAILRSALENPATLPSSVTTGYTKPALVADNTSDAVQEFVNKYRGEYLTGGPEVLAEQKTSGGLWTTALALFFLLKG